MPDVLRNEKVCPRSIRTFHKYVVVGTGSDLEPTHGLDEATSPFDQLEEALLKLLPDVKLRPRLARHGIL